MILLPSFQTQGFYIGDYTGLTETVRGMRHKIDFGGWAATTAGSNVYANVKKVDITGGADTVFLPFAQDEITSVRLPQTRGPTFFCATNMSGCAFYVGVNDLGRNVVFHANSQIGSSEQEMRSKRPSRQKDTAVAELDRLVNAARLNHRNNVRVIADLKKNVYWRRVDDLANTSSSFLGGATIVGHRTGPTWEFWLQVWGSVSGGPIKLVQVAQFF